MAFFRFSINNTKHDIIYTNHTYFPTIKDTTFSIIYTLWAFLQTKVRFQRSGRIQKFDISCASTSLGAGTMLVTVMLVTSLCWWLNGDHFKMLRTKKYVGDILIGHHNMPVCDVGDRYIMLETWNSMNFSIFKQILRDLHRSPTS